MKRRYSVLCLVLAVCLVLGLAVPVSASSPQDEIYGITVKGKTATVQLRASKDCTVIAALYTEQNALLTMGMAEVTAGTELRNIEVTLQDPVPSFHHAKAFLVYDEGRLPLCSALSLNQERMAASSDDRSGSAAQEVTTKTDGSIQEDVYLSVGEEQNPAVTVELPTGTKLEENVTSVEVSIQAAEAPAIIQMKQESDTTTVAYDIQVSGLQEENTSLIKVELQIPANLENLKVYHHETELRSISEAAKAADGTFLYDAAAGKLSIWTISFSPFTLSFGTYKNWQDDFHDHKEAAMTYGYGLVLPWSLRRTDEVYTADLVDFTGSVHQAMAVSQQLFDAVSALDSVHPVLVRFETDESGVMGNVELAKTLADRTSIGNKSAGFGDYQLYNKSRTLVCTEESDGTISYRNVTGLLKDAYTAGDGVTIQYIVNTNADEPLVDCVMVYRGISEKEPEYSYAYALGGTLDAEGTVELVDFSGKKISVTASESLQELLQTVSEGRGILVRYEVLEGDTMGTAEAASIAPEGSSLSGSDYILADGETYTTSKTQFLLCTSGLDGTPVYLPVTGYQNLPAAFTVGEDTGIQYLLEQGSDYFVQYAVIEKAPAFGYAYVVGGTGKKVQKALGADGTMLWEYSAKLVSMDAGVEENVAITKELYDLLQNDSESGLLIRYEIQLDGTMGAVEAAVTAPEGAVMGPNSYIMETDQAYATGRTGFLICDTAEDGTISYTPVIGYKNLPATFTAGSGARIQYLMDRDHDSFMQYAVIEKKAVASARAHIMAFGDVNYAYFETALRGQYGEDYNLYDALVDGERSLVAVDKASERLVPGLLYCGNVEFCGFIATSSGSTRPLYVLDSANAGSLTVVERTPEIEIRYGFVICQNEALRLADDAVMYVVASRENMVSGETVLEVTQSLAIPDELELLDETVDCGAVLQNEENEVIAVYIWLESYTKISG